MDPDQGALERECSGGSGISPAGGYSQGLGDGPPQAAGGTGSGRGPSPSPPQHQQQQQLGGRWRHGAHLLTAAGAPSPGSLPRPRLPAALLYDYLKEPSEEMGPPSAKLARRQSAGHLRAASPTAAAATAAAARALAAAAEDAPSPATGASPPQLRAVASLPVGWGEPVVVRTVTSLAQDCIPGLGLARTLSGSIARSSSMPAGGVDAAAGAAAAVPGAASGPPGHVAAGTQAAVVHGPAAGGGASWHGDTRGHGGRLVLPEEGAAARPASLDTGMATSQQELVSSMLGCVCRPPAACCSCAQPRCAALWCTWGALNLRPRAAPKIPVVLRCTAGPSTRCKLAGW